MSSTVCDATATYDRPPAAALQCALDSVSAVLRDNPGGAGCRGHREARDGHPLHLDCMPPRASRARWRPVCGGVRAVRVVASSLGRARSALAPAVHRSTPGPLTSVLSPSLDVPLCVALLLYPLVGMCLYPVRAAPLYAVLRVRPLNHNTPRHMLPSPLLGPLRFPFSRLGAACESYPVLQAACRPSRAVPPDSRAPNPPAMGSPPASARIAHFRVCTSHLAPDRRRPSSGPALSKLCAIPIPSEEPFDRAADVRFRTCPIHVFSKASNLAMTPRLSAHAFRTGFRAPDVEALDLRCSAHSLLAVRPFNARSVDDSGPALPRTIQLPPFRAETRAPESRPSPQMCPRPPPPPPARWY
ncbi:hypothetical protein B0H15DRAFT_1023538 [Mycena belliarum]|uniref:Uncharacterized protein n=1 Tax=Mycena belliarum TaxID=1033014 RepID=A0AAD6U2S9_9AGAR|nr:hypothetical protein B0H15DRAFT_1023538 [Mycena belliae]